MDSIEISRLYGNIFDDSPKAAARPRAGAANCAPACGASPEQLEDLPLLQKVYWPLTLGLVYFFAAIIVGLVLA